MLSMRPPSRPREHVAITFLTGCAIATGHRKPASFSGTCRVWLLFAVLPMIRHDADAEVDIGPLQVQQFAAPQAGCSTRLQPAASDGRGMRHSSGKRRSRVVAPCIEGFALMAACALRACPRPAAVALFFAVRYRTRARASCFEFLTAATGVSFSIPHSTAFDSAPRVGCPIRG